MTKLQCIYCLMVSIILKYSTILSSDYYYHIKAMRKDSYNLNKKPIHTPVIGLTFMIS